MNSLPDGKGLSRSEWESGATQGWRGPVVPPKPQTKSFLAGFAYGRFWRACKDEARTRGDVVAGPSYPQSLTIGLVGNVGG